MLIVLDTNVLVSGLLNAFGPPGRILDILLAGSVRIAYDDRILAEYEEVLSRPKFGFRPDHVRAVVDFLKIAGRLVSAQPLRGLDMALVPDPDDLSFAEVAVTGHVEVLVTGNLRHFIFLEQYETPVLPPAEFLSNWLE